MKIATFILLGAMALPSVSFADLPITGVGGHGFQGHRQVSFGQTLKNMFNLSDYNKSYAVVVGVSQYNGGFDKLNSARNDAKRMKDFLIGEAGFDYVHMLTESQVTHESLRRVMDRLSTIMKSNDRFLFYWSGHGVTRKVSARDIGYLPLINSKEENYGSMLRMSALKQWDDSLDVKQALYIVDACFSGLAGTYDSKASKRNLRLKQVAQPSRQILTAGQPDEVTLASTRYRGSLFTTAVIDALGGSGDLSGGFSRDGIISASELKLAVQDRINAEIVANPDLRRFKLTPTLKDLVPSRGDFFFLSDTEEVESVVIAASNEKVEDKGSREANTKSKQLPDVIKVECNGDADIHPLRKFYCEKGFSSCPVNMVALERGFDDIFNELQSALLPYEGLVSLDLSLVKDGARLCLYDQEKLDSLLHEISIETGMANQKKERLDHFSQCVVLADQFMNIKPSPNLSETLWANISSMIATQLKDILAKEKIVRSKMNELSNTASKVKELTLTHKMICM